jgi:hypothetical protein
VIIACQLLEKFERQMSHDFQMMSLGDQNVLDDITNRVVNVLLISEMQKIMTLQKVIP